MTSETKTILALILTDTHMHTKKRTDNFHAKEKEQELISRLPGYKYTTIRRVTIQKGERKEIEREMKSREMINEHFPSIIPQMVPQ